MIRAPFYPEAIPLCFASDDYFAPYMAVMMRSIMENASPARKFAFFVLHTNISVETQERLRATTGNFPNFSLDFLDVSGLVDEKNLFHANRPSITVETWYSKTTLQIYSNLLQ